MSMRRIRALRWHGWRVVVLVFASAWLAACAVQPVRQAPSVAVADAQQTQIDREAALREDVRWSLQGRVALANGDEGGSGRIDWQQAGPRYAVSLSAPITRQSWRLSGDADGALLEGLEGGPRRGLDPARLLRESTGWEIPVTALASWVRGARADALGPAQLQFGADGRLARIVQGGWTIQYSDWRLPPATDATAAGSVATTSVDVALPHRLEAVRGEARVRLVVDGWGADAVLP